MIDTSRRAFRIKFRRLDGRLESDGFNANGPEEAAVLAQEKAGDQQVEEVWEVDPTTGHRLVPSR